MDAPAKVYLHLTTGNNKLNNKYYERKPVAIRNNDKIIEYTRTDAFVEKAVEYIIAHVSYMHTLGSSAKMDECIINDFRKYMEG